MTEPIRRTIKDMTGQYVGGCPWYALRDSLVHRVLRALPFFESGQLAFIEPFPSHRLVSAIRHYNACSNRMFARQQELERKERERTARTPPQRGHHGW